MRNIPPETLELLFHPEPEEVFITCVVIEHPSLVQPIYLCNNNVPLTLTDPPATFLPVDFDYVLAPESDNRSPKARIEIDNIDLTILTAVRTMDITAGRALFTGWLVRGSDPDTIEAGPWKYHLHDVDADERTATATLGPRKSGRRAVPKNRYTRKGFPANYD